MNARDRTKLLWGGKKQLKKQLKSISDFLHANVLIDPKIYDSVQQKNQLA